MWDSGHEPRQPERGDSEQNGHYHRETIEIPLDHRRTGDVPTAHSTTEHVGDPTPSTRVKQNHEDETK